MKNGIIVEYKDRNRMRIIDPPPSLSPEERGRRHELQMIGNVNRHAQSSKPKDSIKPKDSMSCPVRIRGPVKGWKATSQARRQWEWHPERLRKRERRCR